MNFGVRPMLEHLRSSILYRVVNLELHVREETYPLARRIDGDPASWTAWRSIGGGSR